MDDLALVPSSGSRSSCSEKEESGTGRRRQECITKRYYIGFFIIMLATAVVVVIAVCVSTSAKTTAQKHLFTTQCQPQTFPCQTSNVCLNMSLYCDGVPDCDDGSDEGTICDQYLDTIFMSWYQKPHDSDDHHKTTEECTLKDVPDVCQCHKRTRLYCSNKTLTTVPPSIFGSVTFLDLSHNRISELKKGQFRHLTELETVFVSFNVLNSFSSDVFSPSNVVVELNLKGNRIAELKQGGFSNMRKLKKLFLSENMIETIQDGAFESLPSLEMLDLRQNLLMAIEPHYFASLTGLNILYLGENRIARIHPYSFQTLTGLQTLDLSRNAIDFLENGAFDGLQNLSTLILTYNQIEFIKSLALKDLINVRSVDLRSNPMTRVANGTFSYMRNLQYIYFDKFYLCLHAGQAKTCEPQGDGISSTQNMLENIILRVCVWIVALLACGGNLLVLLGRFLMREDNQIHSFFIKNLSLADLLMGFYLLIIACHDVKFRGEYIVYDETWRRSWECDLSGVLSTLSTEMSVLTLSVITLDRYLSIMYPLSFRKRGLKLAYFVMLFTWAVCIGLAALPVMGIDYFGSTFYGDNAVCVPLHLHEPRARGWEYSSFLFLGINFGSFGFIAYAYVAMFYAIHMSALPLRTSRESKERSLVKRFFFIVITDFMCWIPIIVIKIMALGGVEISGDLYAWVIVFAMPVNSALNPLLYTLTTNLFKKKLLSKFTVVFRTDKDSVPSRSNSLKNNTSLTRPMQDCEMGLLKRYYPPSTRSTVKTTLSSQASNHRCESDQISQKSGRRSSSIGNNVLTVKDNKDSASLKGVYGDHET